MQDRDNRYSSALGGGGGGGSGHCTGMFAGPITRPVSRRYPPLQRSFPLSGPRFLIIPSELSWV